VPKPDVRQELLDAAVQYVSEHGMADLSLRRLATELGTSHRMLSHHFGSKDGMWMAIVKEVERRQLWTFAALEPDSSMTLQDAMRAWWQHTSDPALWPSERLFFEVYAQALHGRPSTDGTLTDLVESWIGPSVDLAEAMGMPRETATTYARLGLAVTRGLLLDLLATGDRAAVNAAMERWIDLSTHVIDTAADSAPSTARPSAPSRG
jgi:AcrR family transcriptional regulator